METRTAGQDELTEDNLERNMNREDIKNLMRSINKWLRELPPDKSGWLPPTIPKDLVAQHMPEQERTVVGSALKGPVYQGQPVNHENNVNVDIDIAMQGGTIHPPDKSGGILYPSTPRYKIGILEYPYLDVNCEFEGFKPDTKVFHKKYGMGEIMDFAEYNKRDNEYVHSVWFDSVFETFKQQAKQDGVCPPSYFLEKRIRCPELEVRL